ncbi:MAG: hypothetical protein ABI192_18070 [Bradyrhizobium sp.]
MLMTESVNSLLLPLVDGETAVTSVYDLLRRECGLSQKEAADFHEARIDTVISWCSGRRNAPPGVIDELRDLRRDMIEAGHTLAYLVQLIPQFDDNGDRFIRVGLPHDDDDAIVCGFPCMSVCETAVGLAVAELPRGVPVRLVPRVRGSIPTAVTQKEGQNRVTVYHFRVWDTKSGDYVTPLRKSPKERITSVGGEVIEETAERIDRSDLDSYGRYDPSLSRPAATSLEGLYAELLFDRCIGKDWETQALSLLDEFKARGGSIDELMVAYRDRYQQPGDRGFHILESAK